MTDCGVAVSMGFWMGAENALAASRHFWHNRHVHV
jgi:hypothetical protein